MCALYQSGQMCWHLVVHNYILLPFQYHRVCGAVPSPLTGPDMDNCLVFFFFLLLADQSG